VRSENKRTILFSIKS